MAQKKSEHDERESVGGGAFPWSYGEGLPAVDARTMAAITGAAATTVNVWISRGIIPGVTIGPKGRARSFDASLVFHLAVMSVLARLGYDAMFTSSIAVSAHSNGDARKPGVKLIIEPAPPHLFGFRKEHVVQAESAVDLEMALDKLFPEGRPEAFTIVDVSAIWRRVHSALSEIALSAAP
jgi:hypothetical protein